MDSHDQSQVYHEDPCTFKNQKISVHHCLLDTGVLPPVLNHPFPSSTKVFQSSKSLAALYGIPETPAPRTKSSVNLHQSAKSPLVIERFPISELKLSIYIISKPRLIISTRLTQLQLASLPTSVCPEELCAPIIMSMQLCRCK